MFKISSKNIINLEQKLVFLINFMLIISVILFIYLNISLKYFFYFDICLTFILSYFFFNHSKKLAKMLILTNLFIFFYFLYPKVSFYLSEFFGNQSYIFILFYNVFIAFIFLFFSGNHKTFLGDFKKINFKLLLIIILIGILGGFVFSLLKEPIPNMLLSISNQSFTNIFFFLIGTSFVFAFSEQIIFNGFLLNIYKDLTSLKEARLQVITLFVLFHLLRFEILVNYYYNNFGNLYFIYLILYYIALFIFMYLATYFYSFKSKKYSGNFLYPFFFHFMTDLFLFIFTIIYF